MIEIKINRLERALDFSIHCFKARAMSMTTDQLRDAVRDILNGTAIWSINTQSLDYDFISGRTHNSEIKNLNTNKKRAEGERK